MICTASIKLQGTSWVGTCLKAPRRAARHQSATTVSEAREEKGREEGEVIKRALGKEEDRVAKARKFGDGH